MRTWILAALVCALVLAQTGMTADLSRRLPDIASAGERQRFYKEYNRTCPLVSSGWEGKETREVNVSLVVRRNDDPRPLGFPDWGIRTLIVEDIGQYGLSDRLYHFEFALLLGRLFRANVTIPWPCEVLSMHHSEVIVPCHVGWNRYISSPHTFFGYESRNVSLTSRPKCDKKLNFWALLEQGCLSQLPTSFCLSLPHLIFGREKALYDFMKSVVSVAWNCSSEHALSAVASSHAFGYSREAEAAVAAILRRFFAKGPADARFGAIHIRRGDRRNYLDCTNVQQVVDLTRSALSRARADGVETLETFVWFLFVKGELGYADELRYNLTSAGVLVVVERDLHELYLAAAVAGGEGKSDNYFIMRAIHWMVQHATISIRTSSSNDWLWHNDLDRSDRFWVHYLCKEESNCLDKIHTGLDC